VGAVAGHLATESRALDLQTDVTRWFLVACAILFPFWLAIAVLLLAWRLLVVDHRAPAVPRAAAAATPLKATPAAFNPAKDTLVVLPFKNLSGDPKQQYFSDGITQELTGALGQNPALRVIAWETASTLRDSALTARAVGEKLDVANILHGSIAREGD
jgi:hypothetical protein